MLDFYKGKKVFITGNTGFKGSWLCYLLEKAGAIVVGYSLEPPTNPSLFEVLGLKKKVKTINGDVRDYALLFKTFSNFQPEIVFHLAAQAIVREGYKNPKHTYEVNVIGTVNILECIRNTSCVKSFINITTDKVYENNEDENKYYSENDKLDGFDPYSNSKSCSEIITHSYKKSFLADVPISTVRAGNVIGGGDFAKDRIIPDCFRAAKHNSKLFIRNPFSIRPYQHVLEPLFAYLLLAEKQYKNPSYQGWYNVGPSQKDYIVTSDLVDLFFEKYGKTNPSVLNNDVLHEAKYLKLNSTKFENTFKWKSRWDINYSVEKTVEWYLCFANGSSIEKCMDSQILDYLENVFIK